MRQLLQPRHFFFYYYYFSGGRREREGRGGRGDKEKKMKILTAIFLAFLNPVLVQEFNYTYFPHFLYSDILIKDALIQFP